MSEMSTAGHLMRASVSSGTYCKALETKATGIADARAYLKQVIGQLQETASRQNTMDAIGVTVWGVSMTCDIIIDALQMDPKVSTNPLLQQITKAYDKVRGEKFKDSQAKEAIEKVDQAQKVLKKLPGETGKISELFGNMAKNAIGMAAYMSSAQELQKSFSSQANQLNKQLHKLDGLLEKIEKEYNANCVDTSVRLT